MELQADPKVEEKLGEEREEENWRFRTFLKGIDLEIEELDAIVHGHYEDVVSQIDWRACGNCCRDILPTLNDADVNRLATGLGTGPDEVVTQYLTLEEDGDLTFKRRARPARRRSAPVSTSSTRCWRPRTLMTLPESRNSTGPS